MKKKGINENNNGLGKYIYMEWLFPIIDYYASIRRNEVVFEVLFPFMVATICTATYWQVGGIFWALKGMSQLLPTVIALLIGFTIMLITLLLTSNGTGIAWLKKTVSKDRTLRKRSITLYQGLHIQFIHSLYSEILLLLIILLYLFWSGLGVPVVVASIFLLLKIYLTLNILLSLIRGVANLYFAFHNTNDKNEQ